jgi:uncharacterized coiled-coil DUF342 family protein
MNKEEVSKKISHYEWMLETMQLAERHKYWIVKQIQELKGAK